MWKWKEHVKLHTNKKLRMLELLGINATYCTTVLLVSLNAAGKTNKWTRLKREAAFGQVISIQA